jgi:catechol 2,3-dioxygenase-like lactoylglutathione lyase family enzyme
MGADLGLTHVALTVHDIDASVAFYADYASCEVVHRRHDDATGATVVWLSDLTRPFVIVLIADGSPVPVLGGSNHLGVAVSSREAVDRLTERAREEGRDVFGPLDSGPPVGYWAIIDDPSGHHLELSYGQEVGLSVDRALDQPLPEPDDVD